MTIFIDDIRAAAVVIIYDRSSHFQVPQRSVFISGKTTFRTTASGKESGAEGGGKGNFTPTKPPIVQMCLLISDPIQFNLSPLHVTMQINKDFLLAG